MQTPFVKINEAIVDDNIKRFQQYCDANNKNFRPHIKTHKSVLMAKKQLSAGAVGLNCQKLGEAEVFADAGFKDILITYNMLGDERLQRLSALNNRINLTVTADNNVVVNGLNKHLTKPLKVMVECDTTGGRCGVQSAQQALELAQLIIKTDNLIFSGLLTYPSSNTLSIVDNWFADAIDLFAKENITIDVISNGGTPDMYQSGEVLNSSEHRAGTYIYNDRSLIEAGTCALENCALTLEVMVISKPTDSRVIVDAGTKSFSSDTLGMEGFGLIKNYPKAKWVGLSEEHGTLDFSHSENKPEIGEVLSIVPNHACVVSNLMDQVFLLRTDGQIEAMNIDARGKVF